MRFVIRRKAHAVAAAARLLALTVAVSLVFMAIATVQYGLHIGRGPSLRHDAIGANSRALVTFASEVHDFGDVRADAELRCSIPFVNNGSGIVRVKRVQGSCGCISARATRDQCGPLESNAIDVVLTTNGIVGPYEMSKVVAVEFEPPAPVPTVRLILKATVQPWLEVTPEVLGFPATDDSRAAISINRKGLTVNEFATTCVIAPPGQYDVRLVSSNDDIKKYEVTRLGHARTFMYDLHVYATIADKASNPKSIATVPCREQGPMIWPSAYVLAGSHQIRDDDPHSARRQMFRLAGHSGIRITDVASPAPDAGLFECSISSDARSFSLYLTRIPEPTLPPMEFTVHYADLSGNLSGQISLPVRLIK